MSSLRQRVQRVAAYPIGHFASSQEAVRGPCERRPDREHYQESDRQVRRGTSKKDLNSRSILPTHHHSAALRKPRISPARSFHDASMDLLGVARGLALCCPSSLIRWRAWLRGSAPVVSSGAFSNLRHNQQANANIYMQKYQADSEGDVGRSSYFPALLRDGNAGLVAPRRQPSAQAFGCATAAAESRHAQRQGAPRARRAARKGSKT